MVQLPYGRKLEGTGSHREASNGRAVLCEASCKSTLSALQLQLLCYFYTHQVLRAIVALSERSKILPAHAVHAERDT